MTDDRLKALFEEGYRLSPAPTDLVERVHIARKSQRRRRQGILVLMMVLGLGALRFYGNDLELRPQHLEPEHLASEGWLLDLETETTAYLDLVSSLEADELGLDEYEDFPEDTYQFFTLMDLDT